MFKKIQDCLQKLIVQEKEKVFSDNIEKTKKFYQENPTIPVVFISDC